MADVAGLKTGAEDCAPLPGTAATSDATMNAKPAIRFPNKIDIRTSSRSSTAGVPRSQGNKRDEAPQQATYRRLVLAGERGRHCLPPAAPTEGSISWRSCLSRPEHSELDAR